MPFPLTKRTQPKNKQPILERLKILSESANQNSKGLAVGKKRASKKLSPFYKGKK